MAGNALGKSVLGSPHPAPTHRRGLLVDDTPRLQAEVRRREGPSWG